MIDASSAAAPMLADALRRHRLWPDAASHARALQDRRDIGRALAAKEAARAMPSWQALVRNSGYKRRSRAGVRINLAFGHQMAAVMVAPAPLAAAGSDLAACFNLAVSLFDRVCDNRCLGPAALRRVMDEAVIASLLADPGCRPVLLRPYETTDNATMRLLLLAMFAFFEKLECLPLPDGAALPATLTGMLRDAYRAQMAVSCVPGAGSPAHMLLAHARQKSELIFRIMGQLACLAEPPPQPVAAGQRIDARAASLGRAFALIDDIVDLDRDISRGEANTLVLASQADATPLMRCVEQATEQICVLLGTLLTAFPDAVDEHRETVLCWVRSWIED